MPVFVHQAEDLVFDRQARVGVDEYAGAQGVAVSGKPGEDLAICPRC